MVNAKGTKLFRKIAATIGIIVIIRSCYIAVQYTRREEVLREIGRQTQKIPQDDKVLKVKLPKTTEISMKFDEENKITLIKTILPSSTNRAPIKVAEKQAKLPSLKKVFFDMSSGDRNETAVAEIYKGRKQKLVKSCGGKKGQVWNNQMQLIASPKDKLVVCVVQKAGSTSWHKLVFRLRDPDKKWNGDMHLYNRRTARDYTKDVKDALMEDNSAIRAITVRHPFSRLLSGWNDKFRKAHTVFSDKDMFIQMKDMKNYIGNHKPEEDYVIAFQDFIQYLVDVKFDPLKTDIHYKSIETLCHPCEFPYDYIIKAETVTDNGWYIVDRFGESIHKIKKHLVTGEEVDVKEDRWELEKTLLKKMYGRVPKNTLIELKTLLKDDFDRFGYDFDVDTLTATYSD